MTARVAVDANVVLSLLTDRDAAQLAKSKALFTAARDGELELMVPQVVLADVGYVLRRLYSVGAGEVRSLLVELLALPGVVAVHALDWRVACALWPKVVPDFGDALLAASCLAAPARRVATFDRQLRRRLPALDLASYW